MRFLGRACIVWATAIALPCLGQTPALRPVLPPRDCSYEGKAWDDGSYRTAGTVCQRCNGGAWQSMQIRGPGADPNCSAPALPGNASHLQIDAKWDCDANSPGASSVGAVRLEAGKCLECKVAAWSEVDAPVFCNTPQIAVLTTPTLRQESADGPGAYLRLGIKLVNFLMYDGFENAQALIDSTARSKERLTDGTWVGWNLLYGYGELLQQGGMWDEQLALLRKWRGQEPTSGAAALMEASYWSSYAWFARGTQFAANVPREAFKIADQRMARSRAVLDEAKPYASANPAWYAQMLEVAVFQGWPLAERLALFDEGVRAEPLYDAIYIRMAAGLTPRWGGSLDAYHRFVRASVEKTKSAEGDIMYARLYWVLSEIESDKEPFTTLGIPWQRMKSGFDSLIERYPNSQWNLQRYAYFACRAGDGKTFNAVIPKLAAKLPPDMPPPWHGVYTRDYCLTRFANSGRSGAKLGG
jgi:hypothetical protein